MGRNEKVIEQSERACFSAVRELKAQLKPPSMQAVYEHHPRPKQLIVENDLPQKLQNLIEERRDGQSSGGQVLVKQMATSLLKHCI
ncbi:hypothetical protein ACB092_07G122200 [Castanea dentata]